MVNYREILRLKSLRYSNAEISRCVHSSRNTVQEVLSIAESFIQSGIIIGQKK